jgi:hypothetical protein
MNDTTDITKICEGGNAVLHFYGCVMISNYTYQVRKFSVTETRPWAQYNRAVRVYWVEPRKRRGVSKTFAPLRVSDGYVVIEADGEYVYDSRADIPIDMDDFRATRARFGFEGMDEGPPVPPLRDEQRASHQADLDRERERAERYEAEWGKPESKMTREEFDTRQRERAQEMIDTGCNHHHLGDRGRSFTSAERDEIDQLRPDAIKTVRAACGVIERDLRQRFPDVAALLRPHKGPWTQGELDHLWEASEALTGTDRDAYNDLLHLRDIRHHAAKNSYHDDFVLSLDQDWPTRYERPTSPALEQLFTLYDQAEQRWKDDNRDHGRKWLARIESGEAWQQELENRAR